MTYFKKFEIISEVDVEDTKCMLPVIYYNRKK